MGISLLESGHWEDQYTLSLDLYEMSASLYLMCGNSSKMSSCLDEILHHVNSFEDGINASTLLIKLLGSQSKYAEAISNCLSLLSKLGEEFAQPQDITPQLIFQELAETSKSLQSLTSDYFRALPPMTNKEKLHAMAIMSMLCSYSALSKPILIPLISCQMVRLTLQHGLCDDSIIGLIMVGYGVVRKRMTVQCVLTYFSSSHSSSTCVSSHSWKAICWLDITLAKLENH